MYVRPFPDAESSRWQVSEGGGAELLWSRDGREIFYRNGNAIYAVSVETSPTFRRSTPRVLFKGDYFNAMGRQWDIASDGKRFVRLKSLPAEQAALSPHITLIQNWTEDLKRLVPRH